MRLTQALHFFYGDGLTKSGGSVQYSHFVPRPEDFDLRAKIRREVAKAQKSQAQSVSRPRVLVMEDLFE
jgi:hypothetical protein